MTRAGPLHSALFGAAGGGAPAGNLDRMLCARCGLTNAPGVTSCARCGAALAVVRGALGDRPAGPIDTSWLPAAKPRAGLSAAASGLVPNHPSSSIWQVQGQPPAARVIPGAQAVAALVLPGAVMALVYGIYQLVWRRGIFATIASDPISVGYYTARRSDNLNAVLLGVTIALVVLAAGSALWWVRKYDLVRSTSAALVFVGSGMLLTLVAAGMCQVDSASVISIAYVVGAIGCFAISGGLGAVVGRAVQAVTGDTRWVRAKPVTIPRSNASGPGWPPTR